MESSIRPSLVEKEIIFGRITFFINIDIKFAEGMFHYDRIEISYDRFEYGGVVDSLIQFKYPIDKMQAVINNYLLDPEDAYAIEEFNKMQAWRKEAKEIAKEALLYDINSTEEI